MVKSFGLFTKTYLFVSCLTAAPSYLTVSLGFTLYPNSVITVPLTLTTPDAIKVSASLLEQIPALDKYLFNLILSSNFGKGSPCLVRCLLGTPAVPEPTLSLNLSDKYLLSCPVYLEFPPFLFSLLFGLSPLFLLIF